MGGVSDRGSRQHRNGKLPSTLLQQLPHIDGAYVATPAKLLQEGVRIDACGRLGLGRDAGEAPVRSASLGVACACPAGQQPREGAAEEKRPWL